MTIEDEEFIAFGPWWVEARGYPSMALAGGAFDRLSDLLRTAEPLNVSVYRMKLNDDPLVAMVGEAPISRPWRRRFERAYRSDDILDLPPEAIFPLLRRSLEAWKANPGFLERREIYEILE